MDKRLKQVIMFFIITLAWTWSFGFITLIFDIIGTSFGTFLFYFSAGAPSVVGLFFVFITYNKEQKKDYFRRCFSFKKVGWKAPLFICLFFIIIAVVSLLIAFIKGVPMPGFAWIQILMKKPYLLPAMLLMSLLSGPLNEEFGWRGYSIDILFMRLGFFKGNLLLGTVWAFWHLTWYFTPGQPQYDMLQRSFFDAFLFWPSTVLLSYVVSIVYIYTGRSILAGALTHMGSNLFTSQFIMPYSAEVGFIIRVTAIICQLIFITAICKNKRFWERYSAQIEDIKKTYA